LLIAVGAAGGATWWFNYRKPPSNELALYGNVDLRQVELPFNDNERIAAVKVQEGDHVKRGQVLAELDTGRLLPQVNQAQAQVAAQRQVVERLHNGSRPEEIAQARANVASTAADASNTHRQYDRLKKISQQSSGQAVSKEDLDNAQAAAEVADAKQAANGTWGNGKLDVSRAVRKQGALGRLCGASSIHGGRCAHSGDTLALFGRWRLRFRGASHNGQVGRLFRIQQHF
jgi:multidrug resistance efflux pump